MLCFGQRNDVTKEETRYIYIKIFYFISNVLVRIIFHVFLKTDCKVLS